jgi:hypothetical protein
MVAPVDWNVQAGLTTVKIVSGWGFPNYLRMVGAVAGNLYCMAHKSPDLTNVKHGKITLAVQTLPNYNTPLSLFSAMQKQAAPIDHDKCIEFRYKYTQGWLYLHDGAATLLQAVNFPLISNWLSPIIELETTITDASIVCTVSHRTTYVASVQLLQNTIAPNPWPGSAINAAGIGTLEQNPAGTHPSIKEVVYWKPK